MRHADCFGGLSIEARKESRWAPAKQLAFWAESATKIYSNMTLGATDREATQVSK
jgi:hypothetical protein